MANGQYIRILPYVITVLYLLTAITIFAGETATIQATATVVSAIGFDRGIITETDPAATEYLFVRHPDNSRFICRIEINEVIIGEYTYGSRETEGIPLSRFDFSFMASPGPKNCVVTLICMEN
jgi:hypothetical protein